MFRGVAGRLDGHPQTLGLDVDIDQRTRCASFSVFHTIDAPGRQTVRPVLECIVPQADAESVGRQVVAAAREADRLFQAGMRLSYRASGGWRRQKWTVSLLYSDGSVGLKWSVDQKKGEHVGSVVTDLRSLWRSSERPDDSGARSLVAHLREVGDDIERDLRLDQLSVDHADMETDEYVRLIERYGD